MSKPLKPQIRFKGYYDEWQQAKVREVFILGNGYTPSKAIAAYWANGTIPWFRMEDIRENGRVLADAIQHVTPSAVKSSGLFPAGSIIVSTTATIGEHALLIADSLANQRFTVFQTVNRWSWLKANYLLYRFYGLGDWCRRNVNAGGLAAVNISDLQKYDIDYPKEETERDSIAEYFSNLDTQIKEAEREVDRLEKMKIASLQKMFPRPGATAPEIRFAGFSEPWEEACLGNVGDTYTGLSGKTAKDFGHGDASLITYMNVFSNPLTACDLSNHVEIDKSQWSVRKGDIFFTTSSETPEEVGMSSVWIYDIPNVYLNSFCFGFRLSIPFDENYIAYYFRCPFFRSEMVVLAQGISRYNISKNKAMQLPVFLPSLDEQRAIGEYFRNLDELIAAKRKSIVKLRNIKKACLSKMFVNDTEL